MGDGWVALYCIVHTGLVDAGPHKTKTKNQKKKKKKSPPPSFTYHHAYTFLNVQYGLRILYLPNPPIFGAGKKKRKKKI